MRRVLPKTLRGQLVLMIFTTFVVVQGISLYLFADERSLAVRAALGLEAAGRAANVVRLLEAAPPALHADILMAANSPLVRFSVSDTPSVTHLNHDFAGKIADRIQRLLGEGNKHEVRVELHDIGKDAPGQADFGLMPMGAGQGVGQGAGQRAGQRAGQGAGQGPAAGSAGGPARVPQNMRAMHREMMGTNLASVEMKLAISLEGGEWLNVSTRFHRPPLQWPWLSIVSFSLSTLLIMAAVWVTLSRLTGPLRHLSEAADRLGRGEKVQALPAKGPEELRRLTLAFNDMQARLTRFIAERTRLLAALGHDLRSPLTAMRVRSEMVDDDETRERLIAIIAEMQEMVESTLSFARGMVTAEESVTVDLGDYLQELVREAGAVGAEVRLEGPSEVLVRLKPVAMRRALRNVIENAVRYGKRADIRFRSQGKNALIEVRDDGPGIPESELERVFDPFVRVEKSRNLETGGTGLGLSIARTVIHAHGGEIRLQNHPEGGLIAEIILPQAKPEGNPR